MIICLLSALIFKIISKHSGMIQFQKVIMVPFYFIDFLVILMLFNYFRETQNIYLQTAIQYLALILKKVSISIIKDRIKKKLFYDEIIVILIFTYSLDFIFIFNALIVQNQPPIQWLIVILNFINIYIQNILNINIIVEIYRYCLKHKILMIANIAPIYFLFSLIYVVIEIYIEGI